MNLPYPAFLSLSILSSLYGFSQNQDSVVAAYATKERQLDKMNRMRVEPQLTHKLYNTGKGHDAYKLKDGMICLVPDSVILQRLVIVKPKD